jgi:hypothetical protein
VCGGGELIIPMRKMQGRKKIPVGKNRSKLNFYFICPGFTFSAKIAKATKKGLFLS